VKTLKKRSVLSHVVAIILVVASALLALALNSAYGIMMPFALFLLSIIVTAVVFGLAPAITSFFTSVVLLIAAARWDHPLSQALRERAGTLIPVYVLVGTTVILVLYRLWRVKTGVLAQADESIQRYNALREEQEERRIVEETLRESNQCFQEIADTISEILFIVASDGHLIYTNKAFERISGYARELTYNSADFAKSIIDPRDLVKLQAEFTKQMKDKQPATQEFRIIARDGAIHWIRGRLNAVLDADGKVLRTIGAFSDVTESKLAELVRDRLVSELTDTLGKVRQLSGLLPICAGCKRIRNNDDRWEQLETYISQHSEADFTHSMCPDCIEKFYGSVPAGKPSDDSSNSG